MMEGWPIFPYRGTPRGGLTPQEMMLKMGGDPNDPKISGMMILQVGAVIFLGFIYPRNMIIQVAATVRISF